jgi:hypothetical protein
MNGTDRDKDRRAMSRNFEIYAHPKYPQPITNCSNIETTKAKIIEV